MFLVETFANGFANSPDHITAPVVSVQPLLNRPRNSLHLTVFVGFAALDVVRQIKSVHGCGVLLIEHNMSVVMGVCDRIHVLDGGHTLAEGLPADVARNEAVVAAYLGSDA